MFRHVYFTLIYFALDIQVQSLSVTLRTPDIQCYSEFSIYIHLLKFSMIFRQSPSYSCCQHLIVCTRISLYGAVHFAFIGFYHICSVNTKYMIYCQIVTFLWLVLSITVTCNSCTGGVSLRSKNTDSRLLNIQDPIFRHQGANSSSVNDGSRHH